MIRVPTFIVRYIERMDRKSKDYKNSGVKSVYKLMAPSYISPAIFKDLKIASGPRIFFTMASLIIITIVF